MNAAAAESIRPGIGPDTLIFGIGNCGRSDDGLGWAFIDWLEERGLCPTSEKRRHYQLQHDNQ